MARGLQRRQRRTGAVVVTLAALMASSLPSGADSTTPEARWEAIQAGPGERQCASDPVGDTHDVSLEGFESLAGAGISDVVELCLDRSTPGRLAVTYRLATPLDPEVSDSSSLLPTALVRFSTPTGDWLGVLDAIFGFVSIFGQGPDQGGFSCSGELSVSGDLVTVELEEDSQGCPIDADVIGASATLTTMTDDGGNVDAVPRLDRPLRTDTFDQCLTSRAQLRQHLLARYGVGNHDDWVARLNYFRLTAGLSPVVESTGFSSDASRHADYISQNRGRPHYAHWEDHDELGYALEGREAGSNGNVYTSSFDDIPTSFVIDGWMAAPFHADHMLRPSLFAAGFGASPGAATLDVLRGIVGPPAACAPDVVHWPADGRTTWLTLYDGTENPDPLASCPGWQAPASLPVIVRSDQGVPSPDAASLHDVTTDTALDTCLVSNGPGAFFLLAREPFRRGRTYRASYRVGADTTAWTFQIGAKERRLSGPDRFATATTIARTYVPSADTVFLATGRGFADALSGTPAAAAAGAPILLTQPDELPDPTRQLLVDLAPSRVVVLGGRGAVSDEVAAEVESVTGATVDRLSGSDRYATSVRITQAAFQPGVHTVLVATGTGFADALAGGAVAADRGWPLLLVPPDELPATVVRELQRLDPERVVVLGGTKALPQTIQDEISAAVRARVDRVSGPDRYATAAKIVELLGSFPPDEVVVATGTGFADALAAAAAIAGRGAALLLTDPGQPTFATIGAMYGMSPPLVTVVGGTSAVTTPAVDRLLGR